MDSVNVGFGGTDFLSYYGAIVATLALFLPLIIIKWKSRARLKIETSFGIRFVGDSFGNMIGPAQPTLAIIVTNTGPTTRHLDRPSIKLSRKLDNFDQFAAVHADERFPVPLDTGQRYEKVLVIEELHVSILSKLRGNDTLHFIIKDSLGKKFRSKNIKVGTIQEYLALKNVE